MARREQSSKLGGVGGALNCESSQDCVSLAAYTFSRQQTGTLSLSLSSPRSLESSSLRNHATVVRQLLPHDWSLAKCPVISNPYAAEQAGYSNLYFLQVHNSNLFRC